MSKTGVAKRKASLAAAETPQDVIEKFTPAELTVYNELHEIMTTKISDDIVWYWDLGQRVCKVYKEAQANRKLYGEKFLERLAFALLGHKTGDVLRHAMAVATTWPTKKALNVMVELRGEANNQLTYTHLVHLASVSDATTREELARRTLAEGWNCHQLFERVRMLLESRRRTYGGRNPKVPSSAAGCLTHMRTQATKFCRLFDMSWTGDAFDLTQTIKDMPPDKVDETMKASVEVTRDELVKLEERITNAKVILAAAEKVIDDRLASQNGQAEADAADEADEAEDEDGDGTINMRDWQREQDAANKPKRRGKPKK